MPEIITLNQDSESIIYLSKRDKRLAKAIQMVGPITYAPHDDSYAFLVSQIHGQMLANKVSKKMYERLADICCGNITPEAIASLRDEEIREIGTSKPKISYIRALTEAVTSGQINFDLLAQMSDDEVIEKLTSVRGIGSWSAKMYLIFVLNRQDVLPYEDFAFLRGYGWIYKTDDFTKQIVIKKCKKWKPYSSIAARYMYKALDMGFTKQEFHLFK